MCLGQANVEESLNQVLLNKQMVKMPRSLCSLEARCLEGRSGRAVPAIFLSPVGFREVLGAATLHCCPPGWAGGCSPCYQHHLELPTASQRMALTSVYLDFLFISGYNTPGTSAQRMQIRALQPGPMQQSHRPLRTSVPSSKSSTVGPADSEEDEGKAREVCHGLTKDNLRKMHEILVRKPIHLILTPTLQG